MTYYLIVGLFFAIPTAVLAAFVISLIRFVRAKKKNKEKPESFDVVQLRSRKIWLIVTAVLAGALVMAVVFFVVFVVMFFTMLTM